MTELYIGCSDLPRERRVFYQNATAIEYRVGLFSPPKARVLKDWAQAASEAKSPMRSIWVAWQAFSHKPGDIKKGFGAKLLPGESASNFGYFMKTAENMRLWDHIKGQARNVGASRILIETPASFTPSQVNRQAMEIFVKEWAQLDEGMRLIWHPAGFWEREDASEVAKNLGIILAIDPLVDEREALPEGPEAYFQMLGRHGLMDNYSDDDLELILNATAHYDDVSIVFRTCDSLGDARRLIKLSQTYEPIDDFGDFDDDDFDEDDDDFDEDDFEDDVE